MWAPAIIQHNWRTQLRDRKSCLRPNWSQPIELLLCWRRPSRAIGRQWGVSSGRASGRANGDAIEFAARNSNDVVCLNGLVPASKSSLSQRVGHRAAGSSGGPLRALTVGRVAMTAPSGVCETNETQLARVRVQLVQILFFCPRKMGPSFLVCLLVGYQANQTKLWGRPTRAPEWQPDGHELSGRSNTNQRQFWLWGAFWCGLTPKCLLFSVSGAPFDGFTLIN